MRGQPMVAVIPLALMRRPPAGMRLLLAGTHISLAVPQNHFDVNVVPRNSRSVPKHGTTIGRSESLFGMNENLFRANG
ncbi:MAG TPA: hypothetical protein VGH98_01800 [Gemmatimonadaceae bacterium]